jgi:hypothetical protein
MVHLLHPVALSLFLLAQRAPAPPVKATAPVTRPAPPPAPPLHFKYDDDPVEGELRRAQEDLVHGRARQPRHASLIEIPRTMVPALVKSFEDL